MTPAQIDAEFSHILWTNFSGQVTPMLLSTFEHITRGALLNWWHELAG